MDPRRPQRSIIDPKVRQVGFAPPPLSHSVPVEAAGLGAAPSPPVADSNSLSPVMIPLRRHGSGGTAPVPVPPASLKRGNSETVRTGSYSRELVLESTPTGSMSPSSRTDGSSEFSLEMSMQSSQGKGGVEIVSSSFPGSSGANFQVANTSDTTPRNNPPRKAAVVKTPAGVSENNKGALIAGQNEGAGSKPKEKTSKAERRALQDAQRAAKAAAKNAGPLPSSGKQSKATEPSSQKKDGHPVVAKVAKSEKKDVDRLSEKLRKKDAHPPRMQFDDKNQVEKAKRHSVISQSEARNRVELFRHLPQYMHGSQLPDLESKFFELDAIHPSVYKVGLQFLAGDISGANARCIAMLLAFHESIKDHQTPPDKSLIRDLTAKIGRYVSFLIECRPLSISMGNAIRFLKNQIAKLPMTLSEPEAKLSLQSDIDQFINQKIILADKVIVEHAITKISDGDVLLTYGYSTVVEMILLSAHECGKQFRVMVVDSRPKLEGQRLLCRLVKNGLSCTYTHINALSYIMHEVTRVFLGASSVLSNGTVYSRVGTACVAMVAHAFHVPVLICCEAYKFHNRVQLDSICSNELGDPDIISKVPGREHLNHLHNWADNENLHLLNLTYDATPSDYISMIVTDYGMIPPTSVPVIVREYCREYLWI